MSQPAPAPDPIAVALVALRDEARTWQSRLQSLEMATTVTSELGIGAAYYDTGVFDEFIAANNRLVYAVARHCADGSVAAKATADALVSVADAYEADEAANLHTMQNLA